MLSRLFMGGVLIAIGLVVSSQAREPKSSQVELSGFEVEFPALGTLVSIKVFSSDEELVARTVQAAKLRTQELESILTDYDPDSETSKLTTLAAGEAFVPVSAELWNVLAASDRWHKLSQGAFDASIGSLSRLWRIQRRTKSPIDPTKFEDASLRSGWEHVQINRESNSVRFDRDGVRLDFGAIGKGYVVDEIFQLLQDQGLRSCLVNISGNMRCGDAPPDRSGWRIAIAPLEQDQPPLRHLVLSNIAIATSGDLWQYVVVDGQRRSHILDPRTGQSIRGPIAATVLAPTAMDADACATAVCVLGPTAGAHLVVEQANIKALILEHSNPQLPIRYIATPGLQR